MSVCESDLAFCANPECVFHVSPGHVNVEGNGNWAKAPDGIITGRQRIGTVMLCDQCAARVLRRELTLRRDNAA
jgi:hypothetical protein